MVLLLVQDVLRDAFDLRWTNCYAEIPTLPFEFLSFNNVMNPSGRAGFDVSYDIVQPVCCSEADEHMCVVFDATNCDRNASKSFNNPAEIGVKVIAPFGFNKPHTVFRAENEMVVKTKMSRRHEASSP